MKFKVFLEIPCETKEEKEDYKIIFPEKLKEILKGKELNLKFINAK